MGPDREQYGQKGGEEMTRKWTLRGLLVLGAAAGVFLLFAFALQVPAVGSTMGSPQACGTCHVMGYEVKTHAVSAHRDLACLDCHSPTGFFAKPVDEIKTASRHLWVFMTDSTPDIIKPNHEAREIIQSRCEQCHAKLISESHVRHDQSGRFCFECHRETPHGTPLRN